ncbi:MAG: RNA polymerase sigma factor [Pyrinomonadaceae bacterium]
MTDIIEGQFASTRMTDSLPHSDVELLRLIADGDEHAFAGLYRRRQGGIYRFAFQMCGSASLAEDVTQEVFLAVMREAGRYDPARGSAAAYLYGVARNQVLKRLERERAHLLTSIEAMEEAGTNHTESAFAAPEQQFEELARGRQVEAVRQAVSALPAHYREVVVLCELHELSYAEAADALGLAVGTVRSRLHRARGLLCEKLRAFSNTEQSGMRPSEASRYLG